jgi:hypothetical protein
VRLSEPSIPSRAIYLKMRSFFHSREVKSSKASLCGAKKLAPVCRRAPLQITYTHQESFKCARSPWEQHTRSLTRSLIHSRHTTHNNKSGENEHSFLLMSQRSRSVISVSATPVRLVPCGVRRRHNRQIKKHDPVSWCKNQYHHWRDVRECAIWKMLD